MKAAIFVALVVVAMLLMIILIMLFQPGNPNMSSQLTERRQHAIIGRVMLDAGIRDPAVAATLRRFMKTASQEDQQAVAMVLNRLPPDQP